MYDPNNGDQQTSNDMNMRRAQQQMPPPVAPGSAGDRYSQYAMQNRYGDQGPQGADAAPPPQPTPAPVATPPPAASLAPQMGGMGGLSVGSGAHQVPPAPQLAQPQMGAASPMSSNAHQVSQDQEWNNPPASSGGMLGGPNMAIQSQMPPPAPPSVSSAGSMGGQQQRPQYSGAGTPPIARRSSQGPMRPMGGQPAPTSQIRPNGNPTTQTRKPTPMAQ